MWCHVVVWVVPKEHGAFSFNDQAVQVESWLLLRFLNCSPLKQKASWAVRTSGSTHPTTVHHISQDLNPPPSYSWIWKPKSHKPDPFQASIQIFLFTTMFRGRVSLVGIATRYGPDGPGIESRWGRDFPHPSRPALGPTPPSCAVGTGSFPGIKRPGRGVDRPPPSSAEVKERVELYVCHPSGPWWPVLGWTLHFPRRSSRQFSPPKPCMLLCVSHTCHMTL